MYYKDKSGGYYQQPSLSVIKRMELEECSKEEFALGVNPPKSTDELFTEEMVALNVEYDKNMAILANKYNVAVARDGSSETAKVASARAEIAVLDEQYDLDQLAIFNKYYGA